VTSAPFGVYLHVPFCASRCGYCDFNTYTAADLGGGGSRAEYPAVAAAEIRYAAAEVGRRPVTTVFVGGGTPTLLSPDELGGLLTVIDAEFGLAPDAEVTTEANPESVDADSLAALRAAGFTRISFGMQSGAAHVLAVLDRQHTPGRALECVAWARAAGFAHVNLDLIYGTPGPDPDLLADRYELAEQVLTEAGFTWYEVSNWARSDAGHARHNLLYWTEGDWWGIGPGAHSHMAGVRWWNVRHPRDYAQRVAMGSPAADSEELTPAQQQLERVMLRLRLRSGLGLAELSAAGRSAAARAVADGLLELDAHTAGRAVLTLRGRLLADAVIRDLTD
jgi:coproporphyrinogen III oxidase-like Fe-S oxidoreductase